MQKWPNTKRGPESSAPAFRKETLSATLLQPPPTRSPTQPIPSILGLAESVCQVVQGSDYCSIREGGLLHQEAGRCSCLNWPTSTESEQAANYATAPNPFPWKKNKKYTPKKTALCISSLGEKKGLFQKMPMTHIIGHVLFSHFLSTHCDEIVLQSFYVINYHLC